MTRRTLIPALASVLLLGACGGSGDGTADAQASPAASSGTTDFAAYRSCLSEHSVDLPEGGPGTTGGQRPSGMPTARPSGLPTDRPSGAPSDLPSGGPGAGLGMRVPDGVDDATWQAAQEACASLAPARPNGGPGSFGGNGQSGNATNSGSPTSGASQYAVFWRCMSDHQVTALASGLPDDLDTADATVKAALDTCDVLLPTG